MYVCLCHGVTESQIRDAAEQGVRTLYQLQMETGCSTGCGQCESMARSLLDAHRPAVSMFPPVLEPAPA